MKAIKLTGIVAAGALLASGAAFAGPGWSYIDLGYVQGDEFNASSSDSNDNDQYEFGASYGFADLYHVQALYLNGEIGNEDYDGYTLSFGVNPAVTDNTDFVSQIFYTDISPDNGGDVDGYGVKMGLRSMYTDKVELSAYGLYKDLSSDVSSADGKKVGAELGGRYFWTEALSVGIDALLGTGITGEDELRFSARWNF